VPCGWPGASLRNVQDLYGPLGGRGLPGDITTPRDSLDRNAG